MRPKLITVKGLAAGAVGVVLAAGVAGAAANSFDVEKAATTTAAELVESTTTTTTAAAAAAGADATTTTESAAEIAALQEVLAEDPAVPPVSIECAEGNHGKTVSSVAKATPSGPGKGAIVSAAAQSDCGKDVADDEATEDESTVEDDDATEVEDESTEAESTDDDAESAPSGKATGQDKAGKPDNPGKSGKAKGD